MTLSRRGVKKLWNHAHFTLDTATTARSPLTVLRTAGWFFAHHYGSVPTSLRDAFPVPWIFPRPKKVSPGHFLTFAALRPAFQIRPHQQKRTPIRMDGCSFLAEKEGFEPSKPFWGLHDFQKQMDEYRRILMVLIAYSPYFIVYLHIFTKNISRFISKIHPLLDPIHRHHSGNKFVVRIEILTDFLTISRYAFIIVALRKIPIQRIYSVYPLSCGYRYFTKIQ